MRVVQVLPICWVVTDGDFRGLRVAPCDRHSPPKYALPPRYKTGVPGTSPPDFTPIHALSDFNLLGKVALRHGIGQHGLKSGLLAPVGGLGAGAVKSRLKMRQCFGGSDVYMSVGLMDPAELAEIIDRAQRRDAVAFEQLVDAYSTRLFGYLYRMTGKRDLAEDLMQEVFVRVVRNIESYDHDGRFEAWLFRIATNLMRDRVRRVQRSPRSVSLSEQADDAVGLSGTLAASGDNPPDAAMQLAEDVDRLQKALAKLPAVERETVMLRHFSELSFNEIARVMGTPLGTALARAHRGLIKLRELMGCES